MAPARLRAGPPAARRRAPATRPGTGCSLRSGEDLLRLLRPALSFAGRGTSGASAASTLALNAEGYAEATSSIPRHAAAGSRADVPRTTTKRPSDATGQDARVISRSRLRFPAVLALAAAGVALVPPAWRSLRPRPRSGFDRSTAAAGVSAQFDQDADVLRPPRRREPRLPRPPAPLGPSPRPARRRRRRRPARRRVRHGALDGGAASRPTRRPASSPSTRRPRCSPAPGRSRGRTPCGSCTRGPRTCTPRCAAEGLEGPFDGLLAAYLVRNLPDRDAGCRRARRPPRARRPGRGARVLGGRLGATRAVCGAPCAGR